MASTRCPGQKIILCGEYGVGKSSLFRRFATDSFVTATDRASTLGLDHYEKTYTIDDKEVKLQLWDTGGMERVASITSSYYKFAEAAILVFSLDSQDSFNILSQHLLDVVTYAENAKIFLCGNKTDLVTPQQQPGVAQDHNRPGSCDSACPAITDADMEAFCEQCHNLISCIYRTSCKSGEGVDEMFSDIARQLADHNRSRKELDAATKDSFKVGADAEQDQDQESTQDSSSCLC